MIDPKKYILRPLKNSLDLNNYDNMDTNSLSNENKVSQKNKNMKSRSNFLIKRREYFDEYGKSSHHYYYVLEYKKILWWSYWKEVCHTENWGKARTKFSTQEETEEFIKEILCPGKIREGSKEKVVNEIVCINGKSKF